MEKSTGPNTSDLSPELLYTLLQSMPVPACIFTGPDFIIAMANESILKVWGKNDQILGSSVFDVLKELVDQPFFDSLKKVYGEGSKIRDKRIKVSLEVDGRLQEFYYQYTFEALLDSEQQVYGVSATGIDVTAQADAERKAEVLEMNFMNMVLHSLTAAGIFTYPKFLTEVANDHMLQFLGSDGQNVIGKPLWEFLPDLQEQFEPLINDAVLNSEPIEFKEVETSLLRTDELETVVVNFAFQPLYEAGGQISGLLVFATDVSKEVFNRQYISQTKGTEKSIYEKLYATNIELIRAHEHLSTLNNELESRVAKRTLELKRTKLEVENQRARLYRLFMEAPAGICMLSGPDLVFELINPLYQQLFPGRQVLGKPLLEALPEIQGQPIYDIILNVYQSGVTFEGKELLVPLAMTASGPVEDRYFDFTYQARYDTDGTIDGLVVFAYEVTREVNSRKQVEEKGKVFRQVMESMDQLSWTNNQLGEVNFFNQRWHDYTGLNHQESNESNWRNIVHPDDFDTTYSKYIKGLNSGEKFEIENRIKRFDGDYCWHLIRSIPIRNDLGEITLWVGTATNIDEFKKMQQQREEFISIASHELKTPLTSLSGSLQILDRKIKKEANTSTIVSKMVSSSLNHLGKVTDLVNDLLSSTKIEQGQLILNKEWVIISDLVNGCCDHVRMEGRFGLRTEGDLNLRIYGDKNKLDQVLVNLVNNAVKYAPESKEVIIRIEKAGDKAKVSVQDFGPGIPEEKVAHLFDRFYRVDNSGFQHTGLGLGLYICQQIVEKHDGLIGVESELGKGSTFWFTLPLEAA